MHGNTSKGLARKRNLITKKKKWGLSPFPYYYISVMSASVPSDTGSANNALTALLLATGPIALSRILAAYWASNAGDILARA